MRSSPLHVLALASLAASAAAQELDLSLTVPGPVATGATVSVILANGPDLVPYSLDDCVLRILRTTGELVRSPAPPAAPCVPSGVLQPGQLVEIVFEAPDEPGTYAVLYPYGTRAVARLDVGAVDPFAPQLVAYPSDVIALEQTHAHDFADPALTPFELANLGDADHTFGSLAPGDRLGVFAPGAAAPLATVTLDGLTVEAGRVLPVTLPTAGLAAGPYTVKASYADPGAASVVAISHGIRDADSGADLHLIDGHALSAGTTIEMLVAVDGFPVGATHALYALLFGVQPGQTALPGGVFAPLVADGVVALSLGGFGGLLQNHVGIVPASVGAVDGITLTVPFGASLAGLELRAAAIVMAGSTFGASQPELVRFQ